MLPLINNLGFESHLEIPPIHVSHLISQHPFLMGKLLENTGGSPDETYLNRAERNLKTAQEFHTSISSKIENSVSWEEFLLFLFLYGIGKKIAKDGQTSSFSPAISFELIQKGSDQDKLIESLRVLGLSPEKFRLYWEMLSYDSLPLYLSGEIHHDEALDNIYEMAANSQTDPFQFYQLFSALHLVYTASPQEHTGFGHYFLPRKIWRPSLKLSRAEQEKTEQLAHSLIQTRRGEEIFHNCLKGIRGNENTEKIAKEFIEALPKIKNFLDWMHKRMLRSTDHYVAGDKERFREIKRGFRDILLAFHFKSVILDHSLSSMEFRAALKNFRNDYLCRFSLDKVKRVIETEQKRREEENHTQSEQGAKIFLECLSKMNAKNDPEEIKTLIIENGQVLTKFLEMQDKELLRLAGQFHEKNREKYSQLVKDFQTILIYSELVPSEEIFEDVKLFFNLKIHLVLRKQIGVGLKKLCDRIEALTTSSTRSKQLMREIYDAEEVLLVEDHLLSLFPLTFLHGTNSSLLHNLPRTAFHLVSYGRLAHAGIIPYSGELGTGIEKDCINQFKISGTSLSKGTDAFHYSDDFIEKANESNLKSVIDKFLDNLTHHSTFDNIDNTSYWKRFSIVILRVRSLFPDLYIQYKDKLTAAIDDLEKKWKDFQRSNYYWQSMPKDRYCQCTARLWKLLRYTDNDKQIHFEKAKDSMESLRNALETEIPVLQEIPEELLNPYPLLLASKTVHAMQLVPSQLQEFLAHKACLLGRDIQVIGVKKENRDHLLAYLKKNGLADKVIVIEKEHFEKATKLAAFAFHYLNDTVSSKKIAKKDQ